MGDDASGSGSGSGGSGAAEPLLKRAQYHPNCPGCRVDRRKEESEGFPFTDLSCLWLVTICSSISMHLFPRILLKQLLGILHHLSLADTVLISFLVLYDKGPATLLKRKKILGFMLVLLALHICLGEHSPLVLWGVVADKHGRKPVLVITLFSVVIFNTLFGLSSSYWMALTTRGLLSGMLGPVKAYATEVCRKEQGHLALSLISSSRGIGLIVGPAIGGYLAQPADKYPDIFSVNSIFGRFPYFLPCLSISLLAVVALVACFWLPKTLHRHTEDTILDNSTEAVEQSISDTNAEHNGAGCLSLFTNLALMSAITVYCIFSLQDVAYAEVVSHLNILTCLRSHLLLDFILESHKLQVFSLWAVSDRKYGGLSFSSQDVGSVLSISGLLLLIYQILIYASFAKSIDSITLVRTIALLAVALLSSYQFMPALSGFILQLAVTTMTVFSILINDAVSQDLRASANGLSITLMSIFKTIAPAVAGVIFPWAQKRQTALFLPGDHLVFFTLNVLAVIGLTFTFRPFYTRSGRTKH